MSASNRIAQPRFVCLILAFVTLLLYLPVRHHDFVLYDDPDYVQNNPIVQQGLTWAGVKWAFTTGHASNWHPLTWISHMADCQLFGPDPGPQHLVNVLIHAANAVLFFLLVLRLTGAFWPAAFVAGVFAWHPLRVESVAWIAERKDVLCAFFGLLTLLAYERYVEQLKIKNAKCKKYYALALVFFACGLMSKPMLVTWPFVMLLLDYWPLGRWHPLSLKATASQEGKLSTINYRPSTTWQLIVEKIPFFALAAAASAATYLVQREDAIVSLHYYPAGLRLGNALIGYGWYLLKLVWPVNLTVYYPVQRAIHWPQLIAAAIVVTGISAAAWQTRKTRPYVLVGWLWFLGTLVPVIGLVQVGSQAEADRYSYLPSMGLLIALAAGIQELLARRRVPTDVPAAVGAVILGACVLATSVQLRYWQDSLQLFRRAVLLTTDNALANMNLAATLAKLGHKNEAAARYREALRIAPGDGLIHDSLANVLDGMGHTNDAMFEYQEALKYKPDSPVIQCDFGVFLAKTGQFDEAIQHYEAAARLLPGNPQPYYLMGKARLRQGHDAEAVTFFREALHLDPTHVLSLTQLARVLATDLDPGVRDAKEAVALAEQANELTGGQESFVLDTLAAAYAEGGRFNDAAQTEQKAMDAAGNAGDKDALAGLQQRLELYQSGKPYHASYAEQFTELERP